MNERSPRGARRVNRRQMDLGVGVLGVGILLVGAVLSWDAYQQQHRRNLLDLCQ